MATAIGGPRVLLRQLRETMAEPLASQERLDKIVDLIADNMQADVCSFYVLRDDGALELFATHGLKPESVHMTTLRLGEGLVGLIAAEAEPLSLDERHHPSRLSPIARKPAKTRSAPSSACRCCAPARRWACWSCRIADAALYGEDEIEAMLTTATILAEMIVDLRFRQPDQAGLRISICRRPRIFNGVGFTDGIALGKVVLHDPRVVVTNFIAEDIDAEKARLDEALDTMRVSIDAHAQPWRHADRSPSIATFSRATACSPMTAAGCDRLTRRSTMALPPRRRSSGCRTTPAPA